MPADGRWEFNSVFKGLRCVLQEGVVAICITRGFRERFEQRRLFSVNDRLWDRANS